MTTQANPPRPRNGPEVAMDHLTAEAEVRTLLFNRVSWGAVLAGVMVALVTQLILNLIGIGIGAASFDPTSNANPSGSTFSVAAGIWWRLKICSSDECEWAYYVQSKNRSRSYCEYGCGNKLKTRAYRARQRSAPSAT